MTGREVVRGIISIIFSILFLSVLLVLSPVLVPRIFFWLVLEMFVFADGSIVYNILCSLRTDELSGPNNYGFSNN